MVKIAYRIEQVKTGLKVFFAALHADKVSLKRKTWFSAPFDSIWVFQILLRTVELSKCSWVMFPLRFLVTPMFKIFSLILGFSIPAGCFAKGLSIAHYGTIVINKNARFGENCRLHVGVVVGGGNMSAPQFGNNVYIGPGAKIFGDIEIADDVMIGANAVVCRSCHQRGTKLLGVPAHVRGQEAFE